jgi:hypothetical protein
MKVLIKRQSHRPFIGKGWVTRQGGDYVAQWRGPSMNMNFIGTFQEIAIFIFLKSATDDQVTLPTYSIYRSCGLNIPTSCKDNPHA